MHVLTKSGNTGISTVKIIYMHRYLQLSFFPPYTRKMCNVHHLYVMAVTDKYRHGEVVQVILFVNLPPIPK